MLSTLLLASLSLVATLTYLALFISWHVLPTGYDPIRHAVSDYAVGPTDRLFRIGLWASSVGVLALAVALLVVITAPRLAGRDMVFLFLIPVARVGMTLFPTDIEGQRRSRTGVVHYVFAIAAFTFTYLVISETTSALRDLGPASWLDDMLRWTRAAVGPELVLVVITMLRPLHRVFGLFERLFLLTTNVWFLATAAFLIERVR